MDDSSIFSVHAGYKSKTIKCGKSHKISLQRERRGKISGIELYSVQSLLPAEFRKIYLGIAGAGLVQKFKA
jgi:hypothetical protein